MKLKNRFFSTLFLISTTLSSHAFAEKVREIEVRGNQRVEKETIINYVKLKQGEEFTYDKQSLSIQELYKTNLFQDISMSFQNGKLVVNVSETSLVTKVEFSGNNRVKTSVLQKEVLVHQGSYFSEAEIKADVEKIQEIYRKSGRYAVKINPVIHKLENNRVKIVFEITEGPKTSIRYINFVGNRDYKDSELRSVILTKQAAWFRFLDTSDTYDPDRVEYDKMLLKRFYGSVGYPESSVISAVAELSPTKEYFTLTYTLEEGDKYNFGEVTISSKVPEINSDDFKKYISIKSGKTYSGVEIEKISETINSKLADLGYSGSVIYPEEVYDRENKIINIKFTIAKGSKVNINKINIEGNLKTRDSVIRRQFKIGEGDLFNRSAINSAERAIRNLDYFETVDVETALVENSENKADVKVKVEEKSTSQIQFEVGYNTLEGAVGKVNFIERNVLGTGRYLSTGVEKYEKKISYHAGITDPYFMDKDLLAGVSYFKYNSKGSADVPYNLKADGMNVRFGYDVADDLRHDIVYQYKHDNLSVGGTSDVSVYIKEQKGKRQTSSIANSLTYDRTDSSIVPKNGYVVSATETFAGLNGDTKYNKYESDFKIFKSFSNNDYTIKITGEAGMIKGYGGKKVGISDRFNLGEFTMRGFEASGLGPRDKRTNESLGGQKYYAFTTEFLFPVGLPKEFNVQGALFTDVGGLWSFDVIDPQNYSKTNVIDSKMPRVTVGAGIVWITRFAPIRLDYGLAVKKKSYDKTQKWHFRLSTSF